MPEVALLATLLSADFLVGLAVRSVLSGILLFVVSRIVGAKGGLLAAIGVAFLTTIITMVVFESYVFPLLEFESNDIQTALETNVFGLILSFVLPGIVWFFLVMVLLKTGPLKAVIIAILQWALTLAIKLVGFLAFIAAFL